MRRAKAKSRPKPPHRRCPRVFDQGFSRHGHRNAGSRQRERGAEGRHGNTGHASATRWHAGRAAHAGRAGGVKNEARLS